MASLIVICPPSPLTVRLLAFEPIIQRVRVDEDDALARAGKFEVDGDDLRIVPDMVVVKLTGEGQLTDPQPSLPSSSICLTCLFLYFWHATLYTHFSRQVKHILLFCVGMLADNG